MFYAEQTSAARPREYFWDGQWRQMQVLHYTVPVRGGTARQIYVPLTVHGPVLTRAGQTVAVDWMGALGSPDLKALLAIDRASDFAQFRAALASWRSPALTFVYADHQGNIGAISAGYYPQVHRRPVAAAIGNGHRRHRRRHPVRGGATGLRPDSHVIATANQRPVARSYPYYIGTTANFFDPGYRADEEYAYLSRTGRWGRRASLAPGRYV